MRMATDPPLTGGGPNGTPDLPHDAPAPLSPRRPLHLRLGAHGEDAACAQLAASGYRILTRNYRCRQGEIDIVALDGEVLVFVEGKTD